MEIWTLRVSYIIRFSITYHEIYLNFIFLGRSSVNEDVNINREVRKSSEFYVNGHKMRLG